MIDKEKKLKLDAMHHIKHLFQYQYKEQWVDSSFVNKHSRIWVQAFNDLVKEGFIENKKSARGHRYRWKAEIGL